MGPREGPGAVGKNFERLAAVKRLRFSIGPWMSSRVSPGYRQTAIERGLEESDMLNGRW